MITAEPGATYEVLLETGVSGLVGTIEVALYDGQGGVTFAPSTVGIVETPAGTGVYVATRVAPGVGGQYAIVASLDGTYDPDTIITEELLVTSDAPTWATSGSLYVTQAELKQALNLRNEDYFNDEIDLACEASSRAIDYYKGTRFYPTSETRHYTPDVTSRYLPVDDLLTVTSLTLDFGGDGSYATEWTEGTEFYLDPVNAVVNGQPGGSVQLHRNTRRWPRYARAVRLEGTFGWGETPAVVKMAAKLYAARLLKRSRETPYAILSVIAADAVSQARLGKIDPDVAFLLGNIPGTERSELRSVQLG